jgi:hypothetical protein
VTKKSESSPNTLIQGTRLVTGAVLCVGGFLSNLEQGVRPIIHELSLVSRELFPLKDHQDGSINNFIPGALGLGSMVDTKALYEGVFNDALPYLIGISAAVVGFPLKLFKAVSKDVGGEVHKQLQPFIDKIAQTMLSLFQYQQGQRA